MLEHHEKFDRDKHSSLFSHNISDEDKSFVTWTPAPYTVKLFQAVIIIAIV
jgi:hypothetical protein